MRGHEVCGVSTSGRFEVNGRVFDPLGLGASDVAVHLVLSRRQGQGVDAPVAEYLGSTGTDDVGRFSLAFDPEIAPEGPDLGDGFYVTAIAQAGPGTLAQPGLDSDPWFGGDTLAAQLVVDGPGRLEPSLRRAVLYAERTENHGVVVVWRRITPGDTRRQMLGVEVRNNLAGSGGGPTRGSLDVGSLTVQVPEHVTVAYPDDLALPLQSPFAADNLRLFQTTAIGAAVDGQSLAVPLRPLTRSTNNFQPYEPSGPNPDLLSAGIGIVGLDYVGAALTFGSAAADALDDVDTDGPNFAHGFGLTDTRADGNLHDEIPGAWTDPGPAYALEVPFTLPPDASFRADDFAVRGRFHSTDPDAWMRLDQLLDIDPVPDSVGEAR